MKANLQSYSIEATVTKFINWRADEEHQVILYGFHRQSGATSYEACLSLSNGLESGCRFSFSSLEERA